VSPIVLFGAGSPICADVVETCRRNGLRIAAAIRNVPGETYAGPGVAVLEADAIPADISSLPFVLPLFDPRNRRTALAASIELGFREPARLVDCRAIIASDCVVEPGAYVNAGCIVASGSTLRRFAFCNRGANIGHHCRIGAFVSIGPGAVLSGSIAVGDDSLIGAGSIILPKVRIGSGVLIAPGAVVSRDVPDGSFVAGNPARVLARPPASS
jgi:sugar O-acyltransferase (sialic acid O-acetyltransferase NeuD family)